MTCLDTRDPNIANLIPDINDPSLSHIRFSIAGDDKAKIIISNTEKSEPNTADALCSLLINENFSDKEHAYRCYDIKSGTTFNGNASTCANEFEIINAKQKVVVGLGITVALLVLILLGVIIYNSPIIEKIKSLFKK
jgi:hypothetical protein